MNDQSLNRKNPIDLIEYIEKQNKAQLVAYKEEFPNKFYIFYA